MRCSKTTALYLKHKARYKRTYMKGSNKEGQGEEVEIGVHKYALDFICILFSEAYNSKNAEMKSLQLGL